jgi:hypothetical protein
MKNVDEKKLKPDLNERVWPVARGSRIRGRTAGYLKK